MVERATEREEVVEVSTYVVSECALCGEAPVEGRDPKDFPCGEPMCARCVTISLDATLLYVARLLSAPEDEQDRVEIDEQREYAEHLRAIIASPAPKRIVDVGEAEGDGTPSLGVMVLASLVFYGVVLYVLLHGCGVEPLSVGALLCKPIRIAPVEVRGGTLRLAEELRRESASHGAQWVSFGDVVVDDGGNAYVVDREATCYLRNSADMLTWAIPLLCVEAEIDPDWHGATLPAYNVWWLAREAGLHEDDYGRTWCVYPSRNAYVEGLD